MSCTLTLEKTLSFSKKYNDQFLITLINNEETETKKKENNRSCNGCKHHELIGYDSLPDFMKHNEFIINYYRSEWPWKQTLFSVFSIHNETLNIWTHLIGFFIFLALAAAMMFSITSSNGPSSLELNRTGPAPRWPFYAYLAGAMSCLLISSACHLLACHSERTCYVMLRLDFGGISALIVTSFYPLVYYTFACDPLVRNLYMGFITVFGVASVLVSLVPAFERPELVMVRAGLFACMGLSGLVPIMHKMVVFGDRPEAVLTTAYEAAMLSFYGVGVVVYALRIPERWLPGKFDLIGHSHQLWHVLVIAGAYTHYCAGLVYLSWRDSEGCMLS